MVRNHVFLEACMGIVGDSASVPSRAQRSFCVLSPCLEPFRRQHIHHRLVRVLATLCVLGSESRGVKTKTTVAKLRASNYSGLESHD